ncbi:ATP-binding cassette domain-containing protein, partial [Yersinia pestis]
IRKLSRGEQFRNIDLTLHQGEIVSITGLLGAGRTELCLSLFGMTQPESGEIFVAGEPVRFRHNRDAIRHGIGYVSEDRLTQGLIMEQSIYDNTIVSVFDQLHTRSGLLDHSKAAALVNKLVQDLNIKVSDTALPVKTLSGGNAQRIAIAKWVATQPRILILDSPTVGVDIANKEGIYHIAKALAEQGMAVLMICDEIPEAYYNSHRVLVMRKGELIAEFYPHQCTEQQIAEVVNG